MYLSSDLRSLFPLFNSVHLHDCSPFWVGIFIIFL